MAPITVFVNQVAFSNFYKNNNIYPKKNDEDTISLFEKLNKINYQEWSTTEKTFIYCIHFLKASGNQTRLEEINMQQIGIQQLDIFFNQKIKQYENYVESDIESFKELSIPDKAEKLNNIFSKISKSHLIYRDINGISLQKKEKILDRCDIESIKQVEERRLENFVDSLMVNSELESLNLNEKITNLLTEDILEQNDQNYQILLDYILDQVAVQTNSDVSFSRFYTNLSELVQIIQSRKYSELLQKNSQAFSCYVLPHNKLRKKLPAQVLTNMASAISARMVYNSWHYIPGNFISEGVVLNNRDYYFAPIAPDITKLDKYHHVGHVKLSVNNCIRSPFHIIIDGKKLNALMDIRLVRMGDSQYSKDDLIVAIAFTELLANVMQILVTLIEQREEAFSLSKYSKKWYENKFQALGGYKDEKTNLIY